MIVVIQMAKTNHGAAPATVDETLVFTIRPFAVGRFKRETNLFRIVEVFTLNFNQTCLDKSNVVSFFEDRRYLYKMAH